MRLYGLSIVGSRKWIEWSANKDKWILKVKQKINVLCSYEYGLIIDYKHKTHIYGLISPIKHAPSRVFTPWKIQAEIIL